MGTEKAKGICADRCSCRDVVVRTYNELRERGDGDAPAFRSAMTVLALRHPEATPAQRLALASEWLADRFDE
jgi:hypothetical protein